MDISKQKLNILENQIERELEEIENYMNNDTYEEVIFDFETKELYTLSDSNDSDIESDYCVLCGSTQYNHNKKEHKFIACKEQHRCITCKKFFFEHNHINSCYQPYIAVQMNEK